MRIPILFTDLDRTLLAHDYSIHPRVHDAFRQARSAGLTIVISTARAPAALRPIAGLLGQTGVTACYNGAWTGDLGTGATWTESRLDADLARAIAADALSSGAAPVWYDSAVRADTDHPGVRRVLADGGESAVAPGPDDAPPFKLLLIDGSGAPALDTIAARWAGRVNTARSHPELLEVGPTATSKGTALTTIARRFGVDPSACAAAGDSQNDLPMLAAAGHRFAVANALPEIRAMAGFTGASCDDGGLADIIGRVLDLNAAA
jgi:Cof subfamily protein (haloacid dehalogenase superfamily)